MVTTTPGTRCATLLFAVGLSFPAVVRALQGELDFTEEEATNAAADAQPEPVDPRRSAWTRARDAA